MALREWFSPSRILAELNSTLDELKHVQAELLEIRQRFGIDKQGAFLEANAKITLKEFAAMLQGRDCQPNRGKFDYKHLQHSQPNAEICRGCALGYATFLVADGYNLTFFLVIFLLL